MNNYHFSKHPFFWQIRLYSKQMRSTSKAIAKFVPKEYKLTIASPVGDSAVLEIVGERFGPPSKRLVLHQKGLKVMSASVIHKGKNKEIDHDIVRINHLPSFEEVRIHTNSPLYPGRYLISLEFSGKRIHEAETSREDIPLRELFPSIDEPDAKESIQITIEKP
jgi:aminopeptidase N